MTIAYIILAHKHPAHLARLVGRLAAPSVSFFVHIDANTDGATHRELTHSLSGYPNVYLLPRHPSSWASWGIVQAILEGLEQIHRTYLQPDYVILLSGQDYPLKSADEIDTFLRSYRGSSFIDVRQLPDYNWNRHGAIDRFPAEPLPAGMHPFGGSAWWALSGDCAAYVTGVTHRATDLMRLLSAVGVPDEHVIQTIVANSPFRHRLTRLDADAVSALHYVDWRRGSPKLLTTEDFDRLLASPALFARKFDPTQDSAILDMIDANLERGAYGEKATMCVSS